MDPEEILESKEKFLEFIQSKGYQKINYVDDKYTQGDYFQIDSKKLLVVYQLEPKENIRELKNHFLIDRGLSYCALYSQERTLFLRNFGDIKHFVFSKRQGKATSSKRHKLSKIDSSLNILFQTKDISAKFYELFKKKRDLLVRHITNDFKPVEKYLIAQKIFDRFFFIYFLCHKGIIRFEDGHIVSGETLFSKILLNKNFFSNLKEVFRLFNTQNENIIKVDGFRIRIHYLNGGLFRPDVSESRLKISMTKKNWEEIFDFLNSYHWIIEEVKTTDVDEEKILTPEILGHVYERSVVEWEHSFFKKVAEDATQKSERKKKGVYYTPEDVTEFITKNTLEPYTSGNGDFNDFLQSASKLALREVLKRLDCIRILDPACGSGAFLIKAAEILLQYKRRILHRLYESDDFYKTKLNIITKNIYGVDILEGAAEIAKLRLWLWLISDLEVGHQIDPLPNIEYNVRVGDSLVGWLNEKIEQSSVHTPLESVEGIFMGLVVYAQTEKKVEFEKAKKLLDSRRRRDYIEAYYILHTIYSKEHGPQAESLRKVIETIRESIYEKVTPVYLKYKLRKVSQSKQTGIIKFSELKPFHWSIDFGHIIMDGGFDIVIGNPPYGNLLSVEAKKIIDDYRTSNASEIAANFVERSIHLTKTNGRLGFLITNSIAINKNCDEARVVIRENMSTSFMALFNTRPAKIFADAEVRVMILYGKVDRPNTYGVIQSTDAIKFTQEQRPTILDNLSFESTAGLFLGERAIGDGNKDYGMPKVGKSQIREILHVLKTCSTKVLGDEFRNKGEILQFRKTGGYWLNALYKFPYKSTKIETLAFESSIKRDLVLLLVNSSLFYLYWSTYGNLRDLPKSLIAKFPMPNEDILKNQSNIVQSTAMKLNQALLDCFKPNTGKVGEFRTGSCKGVIDDADRILSNLYNLESYYDFIRTYDNHIRLTSEKPEEEDEND